MEIMKPGERFVKCLLGEPIDHVPFGAGIGWHPWGETLQRWQQESSDPNFNYAEAFGYEPSCRSIPFIYGIYPEFPTEVLEETENRIVWRDARGVTQRGRKDGGSIPEFLDYPVKTPDDWQKLKAERLQIGDMSRIVCNWDEVKRSFEQTGEALQVGDFPWGVFGSPRDLMGVENLLIAFYDEPEMVQDMMEHLTSMWLFLWGEAAKHMQIDVIHIWEDMSGRQGSLISPRMVERFMMPCYDRIKAFAVEHGIRIMDVDTDGDCSELLPIFQKHGVNMMFPFEVQAGNDIYQLRKQHPNMGMLGGLDKRALAQDKSAIDREIEKAARTMALGRYVPGFDHLIPPDVSLENMAYAASEMRKVCIG